MQKYVIGLDFGTNEATALVVNASTGQTMAVCSKEYPRWKKGLYCNPKINQWRHHPQDYLDVMEVIVTEALSMCPDDVAPNVVGIAVDTTGSTPALTDEDGTPLALLPEFEHDPNAMFILWKDHTAVAEAGEINALCKKWHTDYTKYVGSTYSAEWFWAKALHVMREDDAIASRASVVLEACAWLPAVLTGNKGCNNIIRSRCAYGHKAMWSSEWGGLPPEEFFTTLDPKLSNFRSRMSGTPYTADVPVGKLSPEWAKKFGLSTEIVIAGGAYDCHMGAVGAGVTPHTLAKLIGMSTCDVMVASYKDIGGKCIKGICGQVDGSVIPGMIGLEAGQSSFGDLFETFRRIFTAPLVGVVKELWKDTMPPEQLEQTIKKASDKLYEQLVKEASELPISNNSIIATDWINGRRSPYANQMLKGSIVGFTLDSSAAQIFRALVEAVAFGSKAIIECFESEGIPIHDVIGIGPIALRSDFVMQTMCDVINKPIKISNTDNACALGAAMFAATAAGLYSNIEEAIAAMNSGYLKEYYPQPANVEIYEKLYKKYSILGRFTETSIAQLY